VSFWLEIDCLVGTLLEWDVGIIDVVVVAVGSVIGVVGLLGLGRMSMTMWLESDPRVGVFDWGLGV
jgi:hypothetical protein